jgi:UDP-2,4-diacetamido-2,4,6-trideoxy-beta-L-altropyranose hydrolase
MNLLFRADADVRMGTGHVMRCLALAQTCRDEGGTVRLAAAHLPSSLRARWIGEGINPETLSAKPGSDDDAEQTIALSRKLGTDWVVLDGYQFPASFQRTIKQAGLRLLTMDDFGHAGHYWADLVLNQNLHADEAFYAQREPYTRLLLGTRFALLRREFGKWRGCQREIPEVGRKVLVTLGGSDPDNIAGKIVRALLQVKIQDLEAVVLAGASNPHLAKLEALVLDRDTGIRVQRTCTDMPGVMAWADMAIAAGGTTSWERALLGLPSLVVILADNQQQMAESAERVGIGWNLGSAQTLSLPAIASAVERLSRDASARAKMAQCGPELVDGLGARRVLNELHNVDLWLRPARNEDCRLIWEWANEPSVRAVSFTTDAIPWERHQEWFAARLNDPGCAFFIGLNEAGVPVGQVRCDVEGNIAVISISVDARFRGTGYGTKLIRKGAEMLFERGHIDQIHAFIRHGNEASYKAFERAGFQKREETMVRGHPASLLVLQK